MTKVLSSISRDSPAATLSANAGDTFSFAGTPTLTGSGGAQRYDFRWMVNPGSGYVPMSGSTGLSTAATNPLTNTNSSTQNAITVTCSVAGTYTIRMEGAPTSGGSYTVFSPTASVTVSQPAITGTMGATEAADTLSASGGVIVGGSLNATEAADTLAASGTVGAAAITGAMAASEGADTFAASGGVVVHGTMAATEAGDTFAASGAVSAPAVTGTLAGTEARDSFAGVGKIVVQGSLSASEIGDMLAASGPGSVPAITGALAATEAPDALCSTGFLVAFGLPELDRNKHCWGPPQRYNRVRGWR